jgi:hypothetical protein
VKTRSRMAAIALALACAAPTVGDIGSCGQEVAELDAKKFFVEKQFIDCSQCSACGFATATCERACNEPVGDVSFDADCYPLVHDGEVCLEALRAAGCDEYAAYIDDVAPTVPTECNFCPVEEKP